MTYPSKLVALEISSWTGFGADWEINGRCYKNGCSIFSWSINEGCRTFANFDKYWKKIYSCWQLSFRYLIYNLFLRRFLKYYSGMISRYLILAKIPVNKKTLCSEIETVIGSLAEYVDHGLSSVSGKGFNWRLFAFSFKIWFPDLKLKDVSQWPYKFKSLNFIDSNLRRSKIRFWAHHGKTRSSWTDEGRMLRVLRV